MTKDLARSSCRDILASGTLLPSSHGNLVPGPVATASFSAKQVDVCTFTGNSAMDVVDRDFGDGNASCWLASWTAIQVVLFNHNPVLGNVGEGDVSVGNIRYRAGGTRDSLNADAIFRVDNLGRENLYTFDDVVGSATHGTDAKPVTTCAATTSEGNVL